MAEHELGKALLAQGGTGAGTASAQKAIRRDRWVVGLLTAAVAGLWLLCVTGVVAVYGGFLVLVLPRINELLTTVPRTQEEATVQWKTVFRAMIDVGHPLMIATLVSLGLAALATVGLIYYSRRATLRQMNAALAELSAEIRLLRTPPGA